MKQILEQKEKKSNRAKKIYWTIITFLAFIGLGGLAAKAPTVILGILVVGASVLLIWWIYLMVSIMIDRGVL
jgi:hypothetical protein